MKNSQQRELLKVKSSVRNLYKLQQEQKKWEKYYTEKRKNEQTVISNYMFCNLPKGTNKFEVTLDDGPDYYCSHKEISVVRIMAKKVVWTLDKLKKKLNKDIYAEIVDKEYTINDMQGLIKYLKSCGVDPKEFKKYIEVKEHLNEDVLNNYYDTGVIKKNDVEGCFEIKVGEPYIKLTELKRS